MAELGVVGSAVGIVSFGIQVCQGLARYYGSRRDGRGDIEATCTSLGSLVKTLGVLEVTLQSRPLGENEIHEENVEDSLTACTWSVHQLKRKLDKIERVQGSDVRSRLHEQGRRLAYPFRKVPWLS